MDVVPMVLQQLRAAGLLLLLLPLAGCDDGVRREYCEQLVRDREWCTSFSGDVNMEIQTERCLENWEREGAEEAVECLEACRSAEEEAGADLCAALLSTFSGGSCVPDCGWSLDGLINSPIDSE